MGREMITDNPTTGLPSLQVIKAGIVESQPSKGCVVVVRASGQLEDGTQVDVHDELTFTLGDSEV